MKVVEAFSGIGSQAKALEILKKEKGLDYKIINTIEWDVNSIYAYDIIHNGPQNLSDLGDMTREDLITELSEMSLSYDGKNMVDKNHFKRYNTKALKSVYYAIKRTNNLISIKDVNSKNFPNNIDLLTYSFPCQDLSLSGFFHGDSGGINKDANNSSSLLWEVERILKDLFSSDKELPRVLLMENVSSIRNSKHIENFNKWRSSLESLGYINGVLDLNAKDFGVPQSRKRAFMVSIRYYNDPEIKKYLQSILIDDTWFGKKLEKRKLRELTDYLKLDYTNEIYFNEAREHIPNDTPSREKIRKNNLLIVNENFEVKPEFVRTITTKQDRHPNSGIIHIDKKEFGLSNKESDFRFLTPREAFLLMGFEEEDYNVLLENNFKMTNRYDFLTKFKLTKMAGNSIVVNILKEIFEEIYNILNNIDNKNYIKQMDKLTSNRKQL